MKVTVCIIFQELEYLFGESIPISENLKDRDTDCFVRENNSPLQYIPKFESPELVSMVCFMNGELKLEM